MRKMFQVSIKVKMPVSSYKISSKLIVNPDEGFFDYYELGLNVGVGPELWGRRFPNIAWKWLGG